MGPRGVEPRLGVDIGGVLKQHRVHERDTRFLASLVDTPPLPGAVSGMARLAEHFSGRLFIVSKCRVESEAGLLAWLQRNRILDAAGIGPDRVSFCRERAEKALHARRLHLTHFVDDRLEVLAHLEGVPHRFLMQPDPEEAQRFAAALALVRQVDSWDELVAILTSPAAGAGDERGLSC